MNKKTAIILVMIVVISLIVSLILTIKINQKDMYTMPLGSNISIMVYDETVGDYVKSDTIPKESYLLNEEKTICISGGTVSAYDATSGTIKYDFTTPDECYLYFDKTPNAVSTLLEKFTGQGTEVGNGKLYLHDSTLANGAEDNSYRYSGANPNNYICFSGDTCNDAYKYRIIGIFDNNIKVIKMTSIGDKKWNSGANNTWENSTLDIYLNSDWLVGFGHSDLIDDYEWCVGGLGRADIRESNNIKHTHDVELTSNTKVTRKIGLMYASDYGYAATNNNWTTSLVSYSNAKNSNWLYDSANINWTISRYSDDSTYATAIYTTGNANNNSSVVQISHAVRPTFYLKSTVKIKSGTGSASDPYIIS